MTRSNCVKWLLVTLLLAFAFGSCAKDTPASSEEQAQSGSDRAVPPGPDNPGPDDPGPEPETPKLDAGLAAENITTEDVPDDYHSEWHILTADDLFAWNEASSHWGPEDKIYIDADIDMANRSWRPNDGFSGLFEGNGHRICRILVDVSGSTARVSAFFGRNTTGTIRNITFGSSNGSSYDQSSQIKMVSQYSDDYSYMGIVAEGSPKMSQVKSFVKLALNDGSVGCKVRMGGLVGEAAAGTTLEQCVSSAEVGLNSGTGRPHSVGGLIGYVSGKSSVRNCSNTGAVTSWSPFCLEVGGLVGANKDGVSLTLENSSNKGAVWAYDWANIMIYDDYSTATPRVNHSSVELFNTSYNYWVGQRKMPASKFIPGLPCYGRPSGVDAAAWLCIPLRTIVANGGSVDADSADNIPYKGTNYTILYNGRPTIKQKVDLCVSRKNGGYFFWEFGEDYVPTSSAYAELNKSLVYYAGNYLKTTYRK